MLLRFYERVRERESANSTLTNWPNNLYACNSWVVFIRRSWLASKIILKKNEHLSFLSLSLSLTLTLSPSPSLYHSLTSTILIDQLVWIIHETIIHYIWYINQIEELFYCYLKVMIASRTLRHSGEDIEKTKCSKLSSNNDNNNNLKPFRNIMSAIIKINIIIIEQFELYIVHMNKKLYKCIYIYIYIIKSVKTKKIMYCQIGNNNIDIILAFCFV